jgi:hypothetical protein
LLAVAVFVTVEDRLIQSNGDIVVVPFRF